MIVESIIGAGVIGVGATAIMDIAMVARKKFLGMPAPDYGLVGRWLASMPRGRFHHHSIAASPQVRGERMIGWTAHYLTGILFAGLLLFFYGPDWMGHPTLLPALIVGIGSVAAPFLLMQPGMGQGIAASRTKNPASSRRRSLGTHAIFGLGLYASGWAANFLNL